MLWHQEIHADKEHTIVVININNILSLFVRKPVLRGFRPGSTQIGLYSHRRWLEAGNFGLVSRGITAKLICVFVFANAKIRFSHNEAYISMFHNPKGNSGIPLRTTKFSIMTPSHSL